MSNESFEKKLEGQHIDIEALDLHDIKELENIRMPIEKLIKGDNIQSNWMGLNVYISRLMNKHRNKKSYKTMKINEMYEILDLIHAAKVANNKAALSEHAGRLKNLVNDLLEDSQRIAA